MNAHARRARTRVSEHEVALSLQIFYGYYILSMLIRNTASVSSVRYLYSNMLGRFCGFEIWRPVAEPRTQMQRLNGVECAPWTVCGLDVTRRKPNGTASVQNCVMRINASSVMMAIALSSASILIIFQRQRQSVVKAAVVEIDDFVSRSTAVITEHFVFTSHYCLGYIFV